MIGLWKKFNSANSRPSKILITTYIVIEEMNL